MSRDQRKAPGGKGGSGGEPAPRTPRPRPPAPEHGLSNNRKGFSLMRPMIGRILLFILAWPVLFLVLTINGMLPAWPTPLGEPVRLLDVGARTFQVPERLVVPDSGVAPSGNPGAAIAYMPPQHLPMLGLRVQPPSAAELALPSPRVSCGSPGVDGQQQCIGTIRLSDGITVSTLIPAAVANTWPAVAADVAAFIETMAWKPDAVEWMYRRGASILGWTLVTALVIGGAIATFAVRRHRIRVRAQPSRVSRVTS